MTDEVMNLVLGYLAGGAEVDGVCLGVEMIADDREAALPVSSLPGPVLTLRVDGPGRRLSPDGKHLRLGHSDTDGGLFFKDAGRGAGLGHDLFAGSGAFGSARAG